MRNGLELIRKGGDTVFYLIGDTDMLVSVAANVSADVTLVRAPVDDWNRQLSPWPAPACFRGGDDFGGGAGEYIAALARDIPAFEVGNGIAPGNRALCGYSLAGLCALYALYVTDVFQGVVSASGSMWFDGWIEFMKNHATRTDSPWVYLSVGDREARARNPRLAAVEECTRRASEILISKGAFAVFLTEPGNHFHEPEKRMARGIDRLYKMMTRAR